MRLKLPPLLIGIALLGFTVARADLSFVLTPGTQPGAGTNEVFFTGSLVNTSPSNFLFLNDLQFTLFSAATNALNADSNAFFANVPGILLPGETYGDVVFRIVPAPATPPGDYFGSVTILGGDDIFAANALFSRTFRISWPNSLGDGIPDWWRQQYFGGTGQTTNDQSCAACDADGTGQNNLFKYTAGLDPTNSASVFTLSLSNAVQPNLIFGPAAAGRTYTPRFNADLLGDLWSPLTGGNSLPTNSSLLTVTDTNGPQARRFYRIQISLP